jgi:LuxR family maltose regulon positive regulatory protein
MKTSILTTKLNLPSPPTHLVTRPRLIERLNEGLQRKLTLISAPAGFGKTTLAGEWVDSLQSSVPPGSQLITKVTWLSLDESDDDSTRFLAYLIAALQTIEPNMGKGVLRALQSPQTPPTEAILTSLINELAAYPHRITVVLDDYHLIDAQEIHQALGFLLDHLPRSMHLVIATREDPHLPLARLRASNQLTELRAVDLRFTSSEAAEFLNQIMRLELSAEDIDALESRTEGWVVGLQLAAISMQGRGETTDPIRSFTGSHRFVLDYLMEEVLDQQPEDIRAFLLQTAILDRFDSALCNALTGQDNSQAILEMLERANLFIVPLDNQRRWYRYHHLFADLLRQRLRHRLADSVPTLHLRASTWYEQNGLVDQAIDHALRAGDPARAAQMIEEDIDAMWGRGEHGRLQRWLSRLPEEVLATTPNINVFQARYLCSSGQLDAAERTLQLIERALEANADPGRQRELQDQNSLTDGDRLQLHGRVAATRALLCSYRGDVPGIIQQGHRALEYLPSGDLAWRGATALTLGSAHGFKGDMAAAYDALLEALRACEAAGDIYPIMLANLQLAITLREQGRLQRTLEICQQQRQFAIQFDMAQTRLTGYLLAVWGETLAELNDLDEAKERAKEGFVLTGRSGHVTMIGWSFLCLMRILSSRGELAEAEETIQEMKAVARESQLPPWVTNQMGAWQARLWLAQDRLKAASRWVTERGLAPTGESEPLQGISYFALFDYLVLARILIAQGHLGEAARLLADLRKAAEAGDRTSSVIAILVLEALTFQAGGETDRANSALARALTLAEPEGFVRVFVDEGPPMAQLLREAQNRGIALDYGRRLLAAFPAHELIPTDAKVGQVDQSESIEPLSEREIEVLQLIAQGLTNGEIAATLHLSPNTVKVHTRNIYGKLGAHHRADAVARARVLGILSFL